jgi:Lrp/AsnC family transcriptional regulator, leucine-responsive regulatory protein
MAWQGKSCCGMTRRGRHGRDETPLRVAELAKRMPQVVECHRVTGEDCFVAKVYLPGLEQLDEILDQFLVYGQTTTSIVQSTPVPSRGLPLPG